MQYRQAFGLVLHLDKGVVELIGRTGIFIHSMVVVFSATGQKNGMKSGIWIPVLVAAILCSSATVKSAQAIELTIVDGNTLDVDKTRYRLHGIDAPEPGQKCNGADGRFWNCGKAAIAALTALVVGKEVSCERGKIDAYGRIIGKCRANGVDLGMAMVRQGHAWAFRKFSLDYVAAETEAKAARLGVWVADSETPWEYRERRWQVAKQVSPRGCPIKGNISRNGRIYHAPWSPWYTRTKVNPAKGERWFCSEQEALNAGWRAPLWGGRW